MSTQNAIEIGVLPVTRTWLWLGLGSGLVLVLGFGLELG